MGNTTCEAYGDMCPMPSTLKQLEAAQQKRTDNTHKARPRTQTLQKHSESRTTCTNQKALLILPNSEGLGSSGHILIYKM